MEIGPVTGEVSYCTDYGDFVTLWNRRINGKKYVFRYVEWENGRVTVHSGRKGIVEGHDIELVAGKD